MEFDAVTGQEPAGYRTSREVPRPRRITSEWSSLKLSTRTGFTPSARTRDGFEKLP
jgi:hypothetical protein